MPLVGVAVLIEEPAGEVVDEFTDLSLFPAVLTLVEVEAVAALRQELPNGSGSSGDLLNIDGH